MATDICEIVELEDFGGLKLPPDFFIVKEKIKHLEVRDDDIWVTSYPKCGTTWCQELVWLVGNDLDYEGAKAVQDTRFPFIEFNCTVRATKAFLEKQKLPSFDIEEVPDHVEMVTQQTGRRFIKSHLPWEFLPGQITDGIKTPKIIHVIRDPKQVSVSFYHHARHIIPFYVGNLHDFIDRFIQGRLLFGHYFTTVLSYWKRRHLPNLLILTYEDMLSDLPSVISKVSDFLGKSYNAIEIEKLADYLSFKKMKANNAVNKKQYITDPETHFIRKGTTDSYKTELTTEIIAKLDKWISENTKGLLDDESLLAATVTYPRVLEVCKDHKKLRLRLKAAKKAEEKRKLERLLNPSLAVLIARAGRSSVGFNQNVRKEVKVCVQSFVTTTKRSNKTTSRFVDRITRTCTRRPLRL